MEWRWYFLVNKVFLLSYVVAFILAPALMKQCLQLPSQTYNPKAQWKREGKNIFRETKNGFE